MKASDPLNPDDVDALYCKKCRRRTPRRLICDDGQCDACIQADQEASAKTAALHAAITKSLTPDPAPPPSGHIGKAPCRLVTVPTSPVDAQSAGCLSTAGCLLSLTGIGAIIGLPMIWQGAKDAKVKTKEVVQGACPHCQTVIDVNPQAQAFNCPICLKRVVNRNDWFYAL